LTHAGCPSALESTPTSNNYSSPVTNAVAAYTQGCPVADHLPSTPQKLGLLCRCYLRCAAPDHLPYVHRHLTRTRCLALHECAIVKPFSIPRNVTLATLCFARFPLSRLPAPISLLLTGRGAVLQYEPSSYTPISTPILETY
jgi:hypothetical protein